MKLENMQRKRLFSTMIPLFISQSWPITQFENEPLFESIKDDVRFQTILGDMKAKYLKEHNRVKNWIEEESREDN